eukprot:365694-Chlamydomonas_euryale.AAC.6
MSVGRDTAMRRAGQAGGRLGAVARSAAPCGIFQQVCGQKAGRVGCRGCPREAPNALDVSESNCQRGHRRGCTRHMRGFGMTGTAAGCRFTKTCVSWHVLACMTCTFRKATHTFSQCCIPVAAAPYNVAASRHEASFPASVRKHFLLAASCMHSHTH